MPEMTWIDKSQQRPKMMDTGEHFFSRKEVLFVSGDQIHKGLVRMWPKGSPSRMGQVHQEDSYFWYYNGNRDSMIDGKVTHWMPLPELPKK